MHRMEHGQLKEVVTHGCLSLHNTLKPAVQCSFKVQIIKPGHLDEDYPITTFFEHKRFSSSFCKRANKIQGSNMQLLKTLKHFEHT